MPASDTVDFEREFELLVRELRAVPSEAPAAVRERVRSLGEPKPRRVFPQLTWRRAVVVLVPACVAAVVAAAAIHGVVSSSSSSKQTAGSARGVGSKSQTERTLGKTPEHGSAGPLQAGTQTTPVFGAVTQRDVL